MRESLERDPIWNFYKRTRKLYGKISGFNHWFCNNWTYICEKKKKQINSNLHCVAYLKTTNNPICIIGLRIKF